ncbi:MAG: DUF1552 domain-containing protein, partial [Phycisphaerales bacterium]|nr:DUF1552 domain-containing protein [Phycisphaerales bacterium]
MRRRGGRAGFGPQMNRRTLLRALGLTAGSLVLPSMMPAAYAERFGAARRIVFYVSSHGTVYDHWKMRPGGRTDDGDWEFPLGDVAEDAWSTILRELYPLRQKLLVVDGLTNGMGSTSGINEHESGHASCLTGTRATEVEGALAVPSGASIDQVIAATQDTPFQSIEYSVGGWPVNFNAFG